MQSDNENRLCIVIPSLAGGGAEKVAINIANDRARAGEIVDLVVFIKKGPYLSQVDERVNLIDIGAKRTRYAFFAMLKYLREYNPSSLLSCIRDSNIIVGLALCFVKLPKVIFREANTFNLIDKMPWWSRYLTIFLMRFTYSNAHTIIANSDDTKADLVNHKIVLEGKIIVIENPVLPDNYKDLSLKKFEAPWDGWQDLKVILAVGRLHQQKGFDFLIKAFQKVYSVNKSARLLIVGEGEERESLESQLEEGGVSPVACILGFQDNIFPYFLNASVFALSSRWEGFGNVLVEALSVGTPVVSIDCPGGPRMILENGKYGQLVAPNDLEAFSNALIAAIDKEQASCDREALIGRASEFTISRVVKKYIAAFRQGDNQRSSLKAGQ